jgi:hypothetical protein
MAKANVNSTIKICKHCGKTIPNSKLNKIYCSRDCYFNSVDSARIDTLEGVCIQCGSGFSVNKRYRYLLKTKKFCSHECSEIYHSGENHHKYIKWIKCNCKICGKEYEVIPYLSDKIKTCRDPLCYKKWMSISFTGENSNMWKGGISFEPYCPKFNDTFKERVRAFFEYKCVECGIKQTESKLSVHHVHYDKMSCCDPNVPRMFVPLCRSCHTKTNHNRNDWREHFEQLIISQHGGRSYYTQDEWDEKTLKKETLMNYFNHIT